MVSAVAILCVRNEAIHIRRSLRDLISDGIDVVLIDNGSTDDTVAKASPFFGKGLLGIRPLPWRGAFALEEQLALKRAIAREMPHEWIIHIDADEVLSSLVPGETLRDGLCRAEAAGATCVNFDEFVFIPAQGEDYYRDDYDQQMVSYYFFQPEYPRLMRAWKRSAALDNVASGGHVLGGAEMRRFSTDFILRHYLVLSAAHARQKYLTRVYNKAELARGWHGNRIITDPQKLDLPTAESLERLPHPASRNFNKMNPRQSHYWEW